MKIKSCEINSFGKLSGKQLEFSSGITVIKGKNESGKSTLSAFIKYVLYGYSGKGRDETGNEKTKYTPWNGLKSCGALTVENDDGKVFRIERSTEPKSSKGVIYDESGSRCFDGEEPGSVFLGIDSSVFTKSAFIGQNDVAPEDMKDLGASLEKLLLSCEADDTDYDKARKILTSEKNRLYRKSHGTGLIPELRLKIESLQEKRREESERNSRLASAEFSAAEMSKKLEESEERLKRLYEEAENIEAYRAEEMLGKYNSVKEKYISCKEHYEAISEKNKINGFLPDRIFVDSLVRAFSEYKASIPEYENARRELEDDEKEYRLLSEKIHRDNSFDESIDTDETKVKDLVTAADALCDKIKKYGRLAVIFLCLVVTLPISLILFFLRGKAEKQLTELLEKYGFAGTKELAGFVGVYGTVYPAMREKRKSISAGKKVLEEKKIKLAGNNEILYSKLYRTGTVINTEDMYGISETVENDLIPRLVSGLEETEKAYSEYSNAKNAFEAIDGISNIKELEKAASKKKDTEPTRTREEVERIIKYDENAKSVLEKKFFALKNEIAVLAATVTDPAEIESRIHGIRAELYEACLQNDALELAIEQIEKAREEIRADVFPPVSEKAGKHFSLFTDGKYRGLFFDRDFNVRVLEKGDSETRRIGFLSSGAADTAYIALRVALAEYLCKNKPTLIFDDSFVKIDDERLSNILNVLIKISDEYQIIILTCHGREEAILGEKCKVITLDED